MPIYEKGSWDLIRTFFVLIDGSGRSLGWLFTSLGKPKKAVLGAFRTPATKKNRDSFARMNKIKILFLAASPDDTVKLQLGKEFRAIDQALRQTEFRERFELEQHWAVRVSDLQSLLLRHTPHVVHFSGHGTSTSEIILSDDDGNSNPVSAEELQRLFNLLKDNIRCVVLNACHTERQASAIAEEIDCVIGMSDEIDDQSAIQFAAAFYEALGYGRDIKTAFKLGQLRIDLADLTDENIPQLVTKHIDSSQVFLYEDIDGKVESDGQQNDLTEPQLSSLDLAQDLDLAVKNRKSDNPTKKTSSGKLSDTTKGAIITGMFGILTVVVAAFVNSWINLPDSKTPTPSVPLQTFQYSIELTDEERGDHIQNATYRIEVDGQNPLSTITDIDGYAKILIGAAFWGKPATLFVTANGYPDYIKEIELTEKDSHRELSLRSLLHHFTVIPGRFLPGNNLKKLENYSHEMCMRECLNTLGCKSFDWNADDAVCATSKMTQEDVTLLPSKKWDHYVRKD